MTSISPKKKMNLLLKSVGEYARRGGGIGVLDHHTAHHEFSTTTDADFLSSFGGPAVLPRRHSQSLPFLID
jgi:hypothetical protein